MSNRRQDVVHGRPRTSKKGNGRFCSSAEVSAGYCWTGPGPQGPLRRPCPNVEVAGSNPVIRSAEPLATAGGFGCPGVLQAILLLEWLQEGLGVGSLHKRQGSAGLPALLDE